VLHFSYREERGGRKKEEVVRKACSLPSRGRGRKGRGEKQIGFIDKYFATLIKGRGGKRRKTPRTLPILLGEKRKGKQKSLFFLLLSSSSSEEGKEGGGRLDRPSACNPPFVKKERNRSDIITIFYVGRHPYPEKEGREAAGCDVVRLSLPDSSTTS